MAANSSIEWTDASWNPVTGCTEVSPGCDHCYAKTFAERFRGVPGHPFEQGFDLKLWYSRLDLPLTWKNPKRIFVNSMSDLFHKDVPDVFIDRVFETMALAHWHIFQVLTKRPKRMARYMEQKGIKHGDPGSHPLAPFQNRPLPNVWLGTSIEADTYTWRADYLRQVPAAIRFISAEPLLSALPSLDLTGIQWLIVGGESGPGARAMDDSWARDLVQRGQAAGAAVFVKQMGAVWAKSRYIPTASRKGGTFEDFPVDLQVREFPLV